MVLILTRNHPGSHLQEPAAARLLLEKMMGGRRPGGKEKPSRQNYGGFSIITHDAHCRSVKLFSAAGTKTITLGDLVLSDGSNDRICITSTPEAWEISISKKRDGQAGRGGG